MMTCLPLPAAMRPNSTDSTGKFTMPPSSFLAEMRLASSSEIWLAGFSTSSTISFWTYIFRSFFSSSTSTTTYSTPSWSRL